MKNKINIAEILKNCPKGMELYSPIFGAVYFGGVKDTGNAILIEVFTSCNSKHQFYPDGKYNTYYSDSECLLFPSKDQRDWSKFQKSFKDGDVVATTNSNWIGIAKGGKNNEFIPVYCVIKSNGKFEAYFDEKGTWCFDRLATEEEQQKLFGTIKANGYKWNAETKTLEKLPKFKVGDKIKDKNNKIWFVVQVSDKHFSISHIPNAEGYFVTIKDQDDYELIPNKFDISTLKPFDKVLVRACDTAKWIGDFYMWYDDTEKDFPYNCISGIWSYCIPCASNEHLLGTTNDCDEYFKTWEN